jgi:hypothetical protein
MDGLVQLAALLIGGYLVLRVAGSLLASSKMSTPTQTYAPGQGPPAGYSSWDEWAKGGQASQGVDDGGV